MSRHIGIFLAILVASSLAGCGGGPSASQPQVAAQRTASTASTAAPAAAAADRPTSQGNASSEPSMMPVSNPSPPAATKSSQFREGVNYKLLTPSQPTSVAPGETEVVEVFWYGCGHCFAFDPAVENWRKQGKPSYVKFIRVPAMWNETLKIHARVFYTAEALGKLEALHSLIFNEIHKNNDPLNTPERIQAFFVSHGVTADEFKRAFNSFSVETKLQRAEQLNRRYKVESVPMIVIDGKYTTDIGSAGGETELFKVIAELAAREHGNA